MRTKAAEPLSAFTADFARSTRCAGGMRTKAAEPLKASFAFTIKRLHDLDEGNAVCILVGERVGIAAQNSVNLGIVARAILQNRIFAGVFDLDRMGAGDKGKHIVPFTIILNDISQSDA